MCCVVLKALLIPSAHVGYGRSQQGDLFPLFIEYITEFCLFVIQFLQTRDSRFMSAHIKHQWVKKSESPWIVVDFLLFAKSWNF